MKSILFSLATAFVFTFASVADDCKCVVSGEAADKEVSSKFMEKDVYFCCGNCKKAFDKNPKKFHTKAVMQLVSTDQAMMVACPMSGNKVNKDAVSEFNGVKVGFCCNGCQKKFDEASDSKKMEIAFGEKSKGFTTQTKCPLAKSKINPDVFKTVNGTKVYFCCEKCKAKYDPNKNKLMAVGPVGAEKENSDAKPKETEANSKDDKESKSDPKTSKPKNNTEGEGKSESEAKAKKNSESDDS